MTSSSSSARVALVTGGAKGIGAEVCRGLAAKGLKVWVADLDGPQAQALVAELQAGGGQAQAVVLDVGDPASVAQAFATVDAQDGRCDVLVNSAGIAKVFPFLDFPLDNFVATMNVNVTGTLLCAQHAARMMVRQRWGRIVNIASVAGLGAASTHSPGYSATKAGMLGMARTWALELAPEGITVNVVCPGPTDTALFADYKQGAGNPEKLEEAFRRSIPLGRIGQPSDLPGAIVFFAGADASYITGQVLSISGGLTMNG